MGLGSAIKNVVSKVSGGVGGVGGGAPAAAKDMQAYQEPAYIRESRQKLEEISKQQLDASKKFRQQAPELKQQRFNIESDAMKRQLADQMRNVNRSASGRGLLYSGARGAAQQGLKDQTAADIAQSKIDIGKQYDQLADQMEMDALRGAIGQQAQSQALQDQAYQALLDKRAEVLQRRFPTPLGRDLFSGLSA